MHPSEGPNSLKVDPQLTGTTDYRPWKRSMEISLAIKRKHGFVTGALTKSSEDYVKMEAWEACNSMVIAWLLNNMNETLRRFTVSNGSRKYRMNKKTYEVKMNERLVSEYYTYLRVLWEELESLTNYPAITNVNAEITAFIEAVNQQKEEKKLFQFLNGLDLGYGSLRSHMLLVSPLPSVDIAVSMVQQEDHIMMFPTGNNNKAKQGSKNFESNQECRIGSNRGRQQGNTGGQNFRKKNTSNAQLSVGNTELATAIAHQLQERCIDKLQNVKHLFHKPKINLPNGGTAYVTHMGNVLLRHGIQLRDNCTTQSIKGTGTATGDLYYLHNQPFINQDTRKSFCSNRTPENKLQIQHVRPKANSSHVFESNVVTSDNNCNDVYDSHVNDLNFGNLCNEFSSMNAKMSANPIGELRSVNTQANVENHIQMPNESYGTYQMDATCPVEPFV
ncbi:uncharacterized protein LOC125493466 [Beta vulgaris subsp. vulgaris]|uniref:uncharacterized protein LOC125493466 n=1 Tax=Beta vulgaris subsp. vulgaris TaxID=3555 RepID=UPI002036C873|nr:uncharacterized protein LOC125493466 [Beta vulgaris subsp. vulgaris]